MEHLPPSTREGLHSELVRLYEKRLVVDELIRSLERYAALDSRQFTEIVPNTATTLPTVVCGGL
jgi:hypothetical protein